MCTAVFRWRKTFSRAAGAAVLVGLLCPVTVGQVRTWVDKSGKHRVEAELISATSTSVTLRNSAGKQLTIPIARLSDDDQAFLREQQAPLKPEAGQSASASQLNQAKPVAKRFYTALIAEDLDEIKTLLTPSGQANWDAAKTLIEDLQVPDNRQAVLVRTAKANEEVENAADVNVTIKVRGKYVKQVVQLRWSDDQWLIASIIPDDAEETDAINFEGNNDDGRSPSLARRGRAAEPDDDEDQEEDENEDE